MNTTLIKKNQIVKLNIIYSIKQLNLVCNNIK